MGLMRWIALDAFMLAVPVAAQAAGAGPGPVSRACKAEMEQHCAGMSHDGQIRACLESNKDKLSPACKSALESTGGGRGKGMKRGMGKGQGQGMGQGMGQGQGSGY